MRKLFVAILLLCLLASSCINQGISYPEELLTLDSLTMSNPKEALAFIEDIEPQMQHAQEHVRRYYELLTIKAADKAFVAHKSDSLMQEVLHYYEDGGDRSKLVEAYYYAGRVARDLGDAPQALAYFQKAIEHADTVSAPDKLLEVINTQIGYLFRHQHLYAQATDHFRQAMLLDIANNDTSRMIGRLTDLGQVWQQQAADDSAMQYYRQAEAMSLLKRDTLRLGVVRLLMSHIYIRDSDFVAAKRVLFDDVPIKMTHANKVSLSLACATLYSSLGELEKSAYYEKILRKEGEYHAKLQGMYLSAIDALQAHNPQLAIDYLTAYNHLYNQSKSDVSTEETALANSLYNYQLKERKLNEITLQKEKYRLTLWFSIISLLLLLAVLALVVVRYKEKIAKIRRQEEYLEHLLLRNRQERDEHVPGSTTTIYDWRQSKNASNREAMQSTQIFQSLMKNIAEGRGITLEHWAQLKDTMKTYDFEFMESLSSISSFSDVEQKLCLLIRLGFRPSDCRILMNRSAESIASIRRRLYEKVFKKKGSPSDWDNFIVNL